MVYLRIKKDDGVKDFWLHTHMVKKDGVWVITQQFTTQPNKPKKEKKIKKPVNIGTYYL